MPVTSANKSLNKVLIASALTNEPNHVKVIQINANGRIELFENQENTDRQVFEMVNTTGNIWVINRDGRFIAAENTNGPLATSATSTSKAEWFVEVEGGGEVDYNKTVRFRSRGLEGGEYYMNLSGSHTANGTAILAYQKSVSPNERWVLRQPKE